MTVTFLLLLLTIALSTKLESTLDSRAYQDIIEDLVEVYTEADAGADVALLLTQLKNGVAQCQKDSVDFEAGFSRSCANVQARVVGHAKKLQAAIDSMNNDRNSWNTSAAKARKDSATNDATIKSTRAKIADVGKQMGDALIGYHRELTEVDKKMTVLKELRDIIEDELLNQQAPPKLIQLKKFNKKLAKLKTLIEESGDTMYTPMIATLVDLASQHNFSDQGVLNTLLKNINNLEQAFRKYRTERETYFNDTMKTLKSQEENLTSQIHDLVKLRHSLLSSIAEASQAMEILSKDIANITSEMARKKSEGTQIGSLCDIETSSFKAGSALVTAVNSQITDAIAACQQLH